MARRSILVLLAAVVVAASVLAGEAVTTGRAATQGATAALARSTSADAANRARLAFSSLLAAYWSPDRQGFARATRGSVADATEPAWFWWEAQAWEAVLDAFQAGDPLAPRSLVERVYEGRAALGFTADYNDDLGWWAMASLRGFDLAGDPRMLATAQSLADEVWRGWDPTGGGIWWRRSVHDQKNVATNATAAIVAARLFAATGAPRYRDEAIATFGWLEAHLRHGVAVFDRVLPDGALVTDTYTYDYGQYLGAAREMAALTGDAGDLQLAEGLADAAMTLGSGGILPDEGTGDGGGFKGVLVRQLALLAAQTGIPHYRAFLQANADAAWQHRGADGLSGPSWLASPGPDSIEVLTDVSAVRLFEQLAILDLGARPASQS